MDIKNHLDSFIDSFVEKDRRDRWHFLFQKNDEKTKHNSYKLLNDLDRRFCKRNDDLESLNTLTVEGVFYDIGSDDPTVSVLSEILKEQNYFDAVFSINAGKLAVFLFHEGHKYVLKKSNH